MSRPQQTSKLERARIGGMLRQARLALGLSLREVARRTSYTPTFISHLERGMCGFAPSTVMRIAAVVKQRGLRFTCGSCGAEHIT